MPEQNDDVPFLELAARYWHPVARSIDIPPGDVVKATLLERDLAIWRDDDGEVGVVDDLCSHRGTRLTDGAVTDAGCIQCPYHAWEFDRDGTCVRIPQLAPERSIPAQAGVRAFRTSEHAGLVWTCLVEPGEEVRARPTFPAADSDTHWIHVGDVYDWEAQAFRQIENFCDVAHFSVLHADTFGNPDALEMDSIQIAVSDDGHRLAFDYDYPALDPFAEPDADGRRPQVNIKFEYRVELPFTVALGGANGPGSVLCVASSPVSETLTRLFWLGAFPIGVEVEGDSYEEFESRVWNPDRKIVEGQRPERLPLDLLEELHLPFDRLAVTYRRQLRALGFAVPGGALAPDSRG